MVQGQCSIAAGAAHDTNSRDLWTEVKKISRQSKAAPSMVDSCCGEDSIAQLFAAKYQALYSQVSYDDTELWVAVLDIIAWRILGFKMNPRIEFWKLGF